VLPQAAQIVGGYLLLGYPVYRVASKITPPKMTSKITSSQWRGGGVF